MPLELTLATVRRITSATDLPLSVDLERGYGDPGKTAAAAIAAGAVGCNIEDGLGDRRLRPADEQAQRVRAVRERAEDEGVALVINARTDVFLAGGDDLGEAVRRGQLYREAGADCVFVPGVSDQRVVAGLVDALGQVSVLAPVDPAVVTRLAAAGVARISFGPGPRRVALAALDAAAAALIAAGASAGEC